LKFSIFKAGFFKEVNGDSLKAATQSGATGNT